MNWDIALSGKNYGKELWLQTQREISETFFISSYKGYIAEVLLNILFCISVVSNFTQKNSSI